MALALPPLQSVVDSLIDELERLLREDQRVGEHFNYVAVVSFEVYDPKGNSLLGQACQYLVDEIGFACPGAAANQHVLL